MSYCYKPGYYLIRTSDQSRYFVSDNVNEYALNKVATKVLSDKTGWDYWIDYCMGPDVFGNTAWANVDFSDNFI